MPHLELFTLQQQMRDNIAKRLQVYGIRAQLPKLELPKLAALNELLEAGLSGFSNLESVKLGRAWLVGLLVSMLVMLGGSAQDDKPEAHLEPRLDLEPRATHKARTQSLSHALRSRGAQVLWCCFRN
jgi:hypothetical protein